MLAKNHSRCLHSFVKWNVERELIVGIGNRAYNGHTGFLVEKVVAYHNCWTVTRLFMPCLRIKIQFNDIPLFYHTSSPTGTPHSITSGV